MPARLKHLGTVIIINDHTDYGNQICESLDLYGYSDYVRVHPDELASVASQKQICCCVIDSTNQTLEKVQEELGKIRSIQKLANTPILLTIPSRNLNYDAICQLDGATWTVQQPVTSASIEALWHPLSALETIQKLPTSYVPSDAAAHVGPAGEQSEMQNSLAICAFHLFSNNPRHHMDCEPTTTATADAPTQRQSCSRFQDVHSCIESLHSRDPPQYMMESNNRLTSVDNLLLIEQCPCGNCSAFEPTQPMTSTSRLSPTRLKEYEQNLSSFSFDLREIIAKEDLTHLTLVMFQRLNLLAPFNLPEDRFSSFLLESFSTYRTCNSYHNSQHAFDTTQAIYAFLVEYDLIKYFTPLESFALLIASVLHDVDHDGKTNTYHCKASSWISVLYGNNSPQENHHTAVGYSLLQKYGILDHLSSTDRTKFRRLFVDSILATDIMGHSKYCEALSDQLATHTDWNNPSHRVLVVAMLLKTADISNPAREFYLARFWAQMIQQEFLHQGAAERALNITISYGMDRDRPVPLKDFQLSFIRNFVLPLFEMIQQVFESLESIVNQLRSNEALWEQQQ